MIFGRSACVESCQETLSHMRGIEPLCVYITFHSKPPHPFNQTQNVRGFAVPPNTYTPHHGYHPHRNHHSHRRHQGLASEYPRVIRHDIYTAQGTVRPRGIQHSLYRVPCVQYRVRSPLRVAVATCKASCALLRLFLSFNGFGVSVLLLTA